MLANDESETLPPIILGLFYCAFILHCCGEFVWTEGVWKNGKRRSGTPLSLWLWPSKSHADIEYRTNASIYYLNMLHYHYASHHQSHNLLLTHAHTMWSVLMKRLHKATQRQKNIKPWNTEREFIPMSSSSINVIDCVWVKRNMGDNTETFWTRPRSTQACHSWHALMYSHCIDNLENSKEGGLQETCEIRAKYHNNIL